jgi:NADPH:quinone reductase-like Zn-dependent oxidoreductase
MGAKVIATSSSDHKLELAKKLGASELINYKTTPAWEDEILRLTNGKGVDLVADVGGSGTIEQSIKALRQGGTACVIGFLAPPKQIDIVFELMFKARTCKPLTLKKGILCFLL